ncbi:hypothetical protein AgCh_017699 [Apium graveolens]
MDVCRPGEEKWEINKKLKWERMETIRRDWGWGSFPMGAPIKHNLMWTLDTDVMQTLQPKGWLDDRIIYAYMEWGVMVLDPMNYNAKYPEEEECVVGVVAGMLRYVGKNQNVPDQEPLVHVWDVLCKTCMNILESFSINSAKPKNSIWKKIKKIMPQKNYEEAWKNIKPPQNSKPKFLYKQTTNYFLKIPITTNHTNLKKMTTLPLSKPSLKIKHKSVGRKPKKVKPTKKEEVTERAIWNCFKEYDFLPLN